MTLTIVSLLPRLQNTNGDAENAAVLATRARWAGLEAAVVPVERRSDLPGRVDAVVLGSGDDSSLDAARAAADGSTTTCAGGAPRAYRSWRSAPAGNCSAGVWSAAARASSRVSASSRAGRYPREGRVTGDVVVASSRFGALVGFENHARDYVGAEGSPLGRVRVGYRERARLRPGGRRHGQCHRHAPARPGAREEPRVRRRAARRHRLARRPRVCRRCSEPRWSTRIAAAARESQLAGVARAAAESA